jgi:hypothetical protein
MAESNEFTVKIILERTTPGALFYRESDGRGGTYSAPNSPGSKIGTQYIRKSAFNGQAPNEISITVKY